MRTLQEIAKDIQELQKELEDLKRSYYECTCGKSYSIKDLCYIRSYYKDDQCNLILNSFGYFYCPHCEKMIILCEGDLLYDLRKFFGSSQDDSGSPDMVLKNLKQGGYFDK